MNGKGIVFLHGWGTNGGVFKRQIDFFKDYATVIAPDIYDIINIYPHEISHTDKTIENIAEMIIDAEISRHDIKDLIVVGWSLGGALAVKLSQKLADITKGIVLCGFNPVFVKSDTNQYGIRTLAIDKLKKRLEGSALNAIEEFIKLVLYGYQNSIDLELFKKIVLNRIDEGKKDSLIYTLSLLEHGDYTKDIKDIIVDTLIINAKDDKLCKKGAVEEMSKNIKNCELKFINGSSHATFFTDSDIFNNILKEFIKKLYERENKKVLFKKCVDL